MALGERRTRERSAAAVVRPRTAAASPRGRTCSATCRRARVPATAWRCRRPAEQDAYLAYQGGAGLAAVHPTPAARASPGCASGASGGTRRDVGRRDAGPARCNQSFAVVQVADYEGLTIYLDNQPVGRTDEHGRVLIEALRPYERNEISVDPRQVPMDGSLSQRAIGVTPAYRSGALVRFPVERANAATMRPVRPDGSAVPAGASATLGLRPVPGGAGRTAVRRRPRATPLTSGSTWAGGECRVDAAAPGRQRPGARPGGRCRATDAGNAAGTAIVAVVPAPAARGALAGARARRARRPSPAPPLRRRTARSRRSSLDFAGYDPALATADDSVGSVTVTCRHVSAGATRVNHPRDALQRHVRHAVRRRDRWPPAPGRLGLQRVRGSGPVAGLGQRFGRHRDRNRAR